MKDVVIMKRKELDQIAVFEQLSNKQISQERASDILKLSLRQVKRKLKRYRKEGPDGLIHKGRGREGNRKLDAEMINRIVEILKTQMLGFGPTFATEKLLELHQIVLSKEALRKIMIHNGLWVQKKKKSLKHFWRERKHSVGELVQLDGSRHIWFGNKYYTLLTFIDDATGMVMYAEFVNEEEIATIAKATRRYIQLYGRPIALYVDRGKVFKVNKGQKRGITQFHRMLTELNIELKFAYTPQAKGRVERGFATHQDRLVKELALRNITYIEQANRFLHESYIKKHNQKFSVMPKSEVNMHRSVDEFDLNSIFCIKETRILKDDNTIVYKNRWFMLEKRQPVRLNNKNKITVAISFDGTIQLMAENKRLFFREISKKLPEEKQKHDVAKMEKRYFKHDFLLIDLYQPEGDISTLPKK